MHAEHVVHMRMSCLAITLHMADFHTLSVCMFTLSAHAALGPGDATTYGQRHYLLFA